jgi:hypothetical protein
MYWFEFYGHTDRTSNILSSTSKTSRFPFSQSHTPSKFFNFVLPLVAPAQPSSSTSILHLSCKHGLETAFPRGSLHGELDEG